ncbi:sarcosine oxidase subunit gamma [Jannaschia sp. W003]|uniref:sarcosine oxidase subunit gamma n=1 Tax=Jannaschia sp. W003 TaxID=2867012 RepID=UPI0021A87B49|nr:sarcosine oxidase subunit gamma family protein [Jannaschia sp. W003]UWQ20512.1 sarcosine oxidase subunit gamma [Jannaschia sp. W003]
MSDVRIERRTGVGMVTLRGDLGLLCGAIGCAVPGQRLSVRESGEHVLWMSPDELLLICDDAPARAAALAKALADEFATVADVSDARAVFDVEGRDAAATLAKLMPVDFARLDPAEVRRTRMAQVPAALWRKGEGWRVVCFRSVADYAHALLRNAADAPMPRLHGA